MDLMFPIVGVALMDLDLKSIELFHQLMALAAIGYVGQLESDFLGLTDQLREITGGSTGLAPNRGPFGKLHMLLHVANLDFRP